METSTTKVWGTSYGLIGDLVMSLPVLTYFEKKYPGSYKYFVIQKKCSQAAPLFINHPLIDKIVITEDWGKFGEAEIVLHESCDVKTPLIQRHDDSKWFNKRNQVIETARLAGVPDIEEHLTDEELYPELNLWFPVGELTGAHQAYSKSFDEHKLTDVHYTIAIWPFANYTNNPNRSPNRRWWKILVESLIDLGYIVHHYGHMNEPTISSNPAYHKFTHYSFFEQIRRSLASKKCIGTDSRYMWVIGAYSHPSINLITRWIGGHTENPMALAPVNKNGIDLYDDELSMMDHSLIIEAL